MWRIKLFLLIFVASFALANPIIPMGTPFGLLAGDYLLLFHWIVIGWLALSIEYLYLRVVLKQIPTTTLLKYFVSINILTYPITCIVSLFISILAEFIPIYFEPNYLAKRLHNDIYSYDYIHMHVFLANMVSFFVGIVVSTFLSTPIKLNTIKVNVVR